MTSHETNSSSPIDRYGIELFTDAVEVLTGGLGNDSAQVTRLYMLPDNGGEVVYGVSSMSLDGGEETMNTTLHFAELRTPLINEGNGAVRQTERFNIFHARYGDKPAVEVETFFSVDHEQRATSHDEWEPVPSKQHSALDAGEITTAEYIARQVRDISEAAALEESMGIDTTTFNDARFARIMGIMLESMQQAE